MTAADLLADPAFVAKVRTRAAAAGLPATVEDVTVLRRIALALERGDRTEGRAA